MTRKIRFKIDGEMDPVDLVLVAAAMQWLTVAMEGTEEGGQSKGTQRVSYTLRLSRHKGLRVELEASYSVAIVRQDTDSDAETEWRDVTRKAPFKSCESDVLRAMFSTIPCVWGRLDLPDNVGGFVKEVEAEAAAAAEEMLEKK